MLHHVKMMSGLCAVSAEFPFDYYVRLHAQLVTPDGMYVRLLSVWWC